MNIKRAKHLDYKMLLLMEVIHWLNKVKKLIRSIAQKNGNGSAKRYYNEVTGNVNGARGMGRLPQVTTLYLKLITSLS